MIEFSEPHVLHQIGKRDRDRLKAKAHRSSTQVELAQVLQRVGIRKETQMTKMTISMAIALALSAVGGVACANPIPTSTDEARAEAGSSVPAPISRSLEAFIASNEDEGRAAAFAHEGQSVENGALAVHGAGGIESEQGNSTPVRLK